MNSDNYTKLLNDSITFNYKKTNNSQMNDINKEAKLVVTKVNFDKRIGIFSNCCLFIMLKDHKSNFNDNPKCHLINPAKSKIGKISKFYLYKINQSIRCKSKFNQWRSTNTVLLWFKSCFKLICYMYVDMLNKRYASTIKSTRSFHNFKPLSSSRIATKQINFDEDYSYVFDFFQLFRHKELPCVTIKHGGYILLLLMISVGILALWLILI